MHVRLADEMCASARRPSKDSYHVSAIACGGQHRADAVHPGYGLSENAGLPKIARRSQ